MNHPRLARLGALALAPALALAALAGCASDDADAGADDASSGGWSYTDDTGNTITLDEQPEHVASFADYAVGMLANGIEPSAIFGRFDVATDPRFEDFDIADIPIVGNAYGEIDLVALAETEPDVIVTGIYPTDREGTLDTSVYYGVADAEQQEQLEAIAPVIAIEIGGEGADVLESMHGLFEALGADEDTLAEGQQAYEEAAAALTEAAESTGLEVTQMYADASGVYVVKPQDEPETQLYTSLGVTFTDLNPDGDYYWDIYSWENASEMMTGDVLLVNIEGYGPEELADQPTFASHPALEAGQAYVWNGAPLDYTSQAAHMQELTEVLLAAEQV